MPHPHWLIEWGYAAFELSKLNNGGKDLASAKDFENWKEVCLFKFTPPLSTCSIF
jgi:hypothetical protein